MKEKSSFVEKMVDDDGGIVRYLQAKEDGKSCWFFVSLDAAKYKEYNQSIRADKMHLPDFGEILLCGWGEEAPSYVIKWMKYKYDVAC